MISDSWLVVGDETGDWDMCNGQFASDEIGVALVAGELSTWNRALQMPLCGTQALNVFSTPIHKQVKTQWQSKKYHVSDVPLPSSGSGLKLDTEYANPSRRMLCEHARWLLQESGLGILTVHGDSTRLRSAGIGHSGDGMRERAKVFAALSGLLIVFLPSDATLNLVIEGRTESPDADVVGPASNSKRPQEPYRDFMAAFNEQLGRIAQRHQSLVVEGSLTQDFYIGKKIFKTHLTTSQRRNSRNVFLTEHTEQVIKAMNGIADLATALIPKSKPTIVVPPSDQNTIWSLTFKELRDAINL